MSNTSREERVREEAFLLWNAAGRPEGRADEFWRQAEKVVDDADALTVREDRRGNL